MGAASILLLLIVYVFPIVCFWKILPRAGMASWISLACLIPLGMFVLLGVLAFKEWPDNHSSPEVFN